MKSKIYVLALNDWEDYQPYYFECNCSKKDFRKEVTGAMEKAALKSSKKSNRNYVDGYALLKIAIPLLKKKFRLIEADYEIQFEGMCLYSSSQRRPTIIPKQSWHKIIEHNKKIDKMDNLK